MNQAKGLTSALVVAPIAIELNGNRRYIQSKPSHTTDYFHGVVNFFQIVKEQSRH